MDGDAAQSGAFFVVGAAGRQRNQRRKKAKDLFQSDNHTASCCIAQRYNVYREYYVYSQYEKTLAPAIMTEMMIIRLEEPKDWREVEILTRGAFWNVYRPDGVAEQHSFDDCCDRQRI